MTVEELYQKFVSLVTMLQKDLPALKAGMNKVSTEHAELLRRVQALEAKSATPTDTQQDDQRIVGVHPITRRPVTAAEAAKDPKLAMRMQFAEDDA